MNLLDTRCTAVGALRALNLQGGYSSRRRVSCRPPAFVANALAGRHPRARAAARAAPARRRTHWTEARSRASPSPTWSGTAVGGAAPAEHRPRRRRPLMQRRHTPTPDDNVVVSRPQLARHHHQVWLQLFFLCRPVRRHHEGESIHAYPLTPPLLRLPFGWVVSVPQHRHSGGVQILTCNYCNL